MIGYVSVGVKDLDKAAAYYDTLFAEIGAVRALVMDRFIMWGTGPGKPGFAICSPFNEEPAQCGNGNMTAFAVENTDQVKKLYNKAIELGGSCEGEPGPRGDSGFYAGFFRDPDGNKLNAFCMTTKP